MKLLAVILLVLAYGPCLLANVLSGWYSPAPTPVYPTKTFSDVFTTLRATVQVPPTSVVVRDHNNVGELAALPITSFYGTASSIVFPLALPRPFPLTALFICVFEGKIFSTASTISILTASPVPSTHASTDDVAFAPKPAHHVQMLWNGVIHWFQHELGRLIEQVTVFYLYAWTFLVAALVLLRKRGLVRPIVTTQLAAQFEPTRAPLAWIEVRSVEGLLLLFSYTTNSPKSADQWTSLWIPRRRYTYYLSNGPADCDADFKTAASGLLDILLQSVSTYQPWAPQLAGNILVAVPTSSHTSEPTVQTKSTAASELCPRRRPHFRPAISRFGGPPAQVASQFFAPKREYFLVEWIKIPSEEGAIILYGYSTTSTGRPTKWTSQYFPCHPHTYYLSDRPANLDSLLLGILLQSTSIYYPWAPELAGVLVNNAGGIVEEIPLIASTDSEVAVKMDTLPHTESKPNTPDQPSVIDTPPTSVDHAESRLDTGLEAPKTLSLEDTDNAGGFDSNRVQASSTLPLPPLAPRYPTLNPSPVWNGKNTASQPAAYAFPASETPTSQGHPSQFGPPVGPSFQSPRVLPPFHNNTFAYQRGQQVYRSATTSFAYQHGPNVSQPNTTSFGYQHTPTPYHLNTTSVGYQHAPMPYHPCATPAAYQPRPMVFLPYTYQHLTAYHQQPNHMMMPQPQTIQQVAAVRQEVRPLLPFLADRASQRQDPGFWATGSTGFREAMAEELEPEEAQKKKFRRGGRRLTARRHRWEELERQRREEEDPDAGPSGLGQH